MANSKSLNEYEKPSKLGYSYQDVRSMSDERIIKAGLGSGDRLATELANRLDLSLEHPMDYEEVLADHKRLVRELDVLLNGGGAARQASLCDIVSQVRRERIRSWGYRYRSPQ